MTLRDLATAGGPDPAGFDVADGRELDTAWARLRPLGVGAVPHLVDAYRTAQAWQGRGAAVWHATRYARTHEPAFQLGLEALSDRSSYVRARACGLLAYSLRQDAVGRLMLLLNHADRDTRDDAQAALNAIVEQNHHLFKDRDRSGRVFWVVDNTDLPHP